MGFGSAAGFSHPMRHLASVLVALLAAVPLAGQHAVGKRPGPAVGLLSAPALHFANARNDEYVSYMKWFVGGGAAAGAFLTAALCDHSADEDGGNGNRQEEKNGAGICGRSIAGSALNGALLGALSGFLAHYTIEKMAYYSFSPGVDRPVDLVKFRVPIGFGR